MIVNHTKTPQAKNSKWKALPPLGPYYGKDWFIEREGEGAFNPVIKWKYCPRINLRCFLCLHRGQAEVDKVCCNIDVNLALFEDSADVGWVTTNRFRQEGSAFKYVMDPDCNFCGQKKQNIVQVFTSCPCIQGLFANFGRHYKLQYPLTNAEMEVGMDTNLDQRKITLKHLNLLRRYVYSCVHAKAMPRWEEILHQIDQAYVLEYAIADKAGVVHKVLREWEL
jgi:hypothetical protein